MCYNSHATSYFRRKNRSMTNLERRIPQGIEHLIAAICEDYPRRKHEIETGTGDPETLAEYRRLNDLVDDALEESCEPAIREEMRRDLALRRGAHYTQIWQMGEGTYKNRKRLCKLAIAKRLRLL